MTNKSRMSFTDRFFRANRRVRYFVLGNDQCGIFAHFRILDWNGADSRRLFNATGIDADAGDWLTGIFDEPVTVCGQLYPKGTVAVFQGKWPGSRFALFSADDMGMDQPTELYSMEYQPTGESEKKLTLQAKKHQFVDDAIHWAMAHRGQKVIELNGEFFTVDKRAFQLIVLTGCAGVVFKWDDDSDELSWKPFNDGGLASKVVPH